MVGIISLRRNFQQCMRRRNSMKEIYNGETVALGGVNLVTKQVVVDDSTGERANFTK